MLNTLIEKLRPGIFDRTDTRRGRLVAVFDEQTRERIARERKYFTRVKTPKGEVRQPTQELVRQGKKLRRILPKFIPEKEILGVYVTGSHARGYRLKRIEASPPDLDLLVLVESNYWRKSPFCKRDHPNMLLLNVIMNGHRYTSSQVKAFFNGDEPHGVDKGNFVHVIVDEQITWGVDYPLYDLRNNRWVKLKRF